MTTRLITRLAQLLLTLALACTGVLVAQPAAEAATVVKFCFKHQADGMYGGAPYASKTVYLKNSATGATIKTGRTNSAGCGSFSRVSSRLSVYVKAYTTYGDGSIGMAVYEGNTPYSSRTGSGSVNLGTGTVYLSCVEGIDAYCAGAF